jgi:mRNA-degrading endonuclease toxin of MazEF toxin-antitoxin module
VIVVQDDAAIELSTRFCVPTSGSAAPSRWRIEVEFDGEESLALCEQLLTISNERLRPERFAGTIGYGVLQEIRTVTSALLGAGTGPAPLR